jgi:hypothetical protein
MKVKDAVALLLQQDQEATIIAAVGWSGDTTYSDEDYDLKIHTIDGRVVVEGWLSNCGTELEIVDEEEDSSDEDGSG